METLKADSKPSSLNILRRHYIKVVRLGQYVKDKVSDNRYTKVTRVARENNGMKKLIETAYVCYDPNFHIGDDDDQLDDPSVLSLGEHATQAEVTNPSN
jgi:hypothetical protein